MLAEYFQIKIDEEGNLIGLPQIFENNIPDLRRLPLFILNLCTEVNWEEEQSCFNDIALQLAEFYHYQNIPNDSEFLNEEEMKNREWNVRHLLLPSFRSSFSPPRKFANDGSIIQIASLENLYKIFERC